MNTSGRIARCMGRVEFRACEAEILDMHTKGYANKHIYDKLTKDGKLTLAYSTFNCHLRKLLKPKQSNYKQIDAVAKQDQKKFIIPSDGI